MAPPNSRHAIFIANSSQGAHCLARPRAKSRTTRHGECGMVKTLAAIGISADIALAPLAAFAQTDTTAPAAGAAPATDSAAPAADSMKKTTKHKKHMAKKAKKPAADDATPA